MVRKTKEEAELTRAEIINAARRAFLEFGVSRTSLEKVAQIAGVTRGAIYWHFSNKAELFHAMREEATESLNHIHVYLDSEDIPNPLDALEKSLFEFVNVLQNNPLVRQTFEIMLWRCEYVDEFASVLYEVTRPRQDYLPILETVYRRAASKGYLRPTLDPKALAYDTQSFTTGLINIWLANALNAEQRSQVNAMIRDHIALRRRD